MFLKLSLCALWLCGKAFALAIDPFLWISHVSGNNQRSALRIAT